METLENVRNDSNLKISKSRKLRTKYEIKRLDEIQTQTIQTQTIQIKVAYRKRSRFYKYNILFNSNPKQFYRNISKSQIKINKAPSEE